MKSRVLKNTQEIRLHGKVIGTVKTPLGIIEIIGLEKSRGYTTNYQPKQFQYVRMPTGEIASLKQYTLNHWKNQGWEIEWKESI